MLLSQIEANWSSGVKLLYQEVSTAVEDRVCRSTCRKGVDRAFTSRTGSADGSYQLCKHLMHQYKRVNV